MKESMAMANDRRGADQKHFDFMTKMSEFSQISRLQDENQKVRMF